MKKSNEILGLPIISITEGRELGVSKSLLIDAENGTIAALTIEDDEWYRGVKLIPYESIIAIGEDAITITHSDNILNLDEAGDYERLLGENIRVIGTKAISKTGRIQGKISEVFIGEDGRIEQCEITTSEGSTTLVTDDQISIFGKEVTVVDIEDDEKKNSLIKPPAPKVEAPAPKTKPSTPKVEAPAPKVEPPAFEPAFEMFSEPAKVETSEPVKVETPAPKVKEPEPKVEVPAPKVKESEPKVETPEPKVETPEPKVETSEPKVETPEPKVETSEPKVEAPAPKVEAPATKAKTPAAKTEPSAESKLSDEEQRIASMTQQAEDLKAALQKARAGKQARTAAQAPPQQPQLSQKKQVEKAVDERRRRVLLGKHATKAIIAESGTIVVEAGAEVTEDVLQRARLANKFIELSMNVQ